MARLTYVNDFVTYLVLTYVKSRVTCAACFKLNHVPLTRGGSSVPQTRSAPRIWTTAFIVMYSPVSPCWPSVWKPGEAAQVKCLDLESPSATVPLGQKFDRGFKRRKVRSFDLGSN